MARSTCRTGWARYRRGLSRGEQNRRALADALAALADDRSTLEGLPDVEPVGQVEDLVLDQVEDLVLDQLWARPALVDALRSMPSVAVLRDALAPPEPADWEEAMARLLESGPMLMIAPRGRTCRDHASAGARLLGVGGEPISVLLQRAREQSQWRF